MHHGNIHLNDGVFEPGWIHPIHNWEYADETARETATGFVDADLKKIALQLDENSFWVLTATTPVWTSFGGGGDSWVSAPATATSTGTAGQKAYDAFYFYLCVATDTWVRAPLGSW